MNGGVLLWARTELRRRWSILALLAVVVATAGGATVAAVAAAHRTGTAFGRMLVATRQPNLAVNGAGENGFVDLDPRLLDRVMAIPGVKGASEFAFVAVAPDGFVNFFALAIVDRRGETERPLWLQGHPIDDYRAFSAGDLLINESMHHQLGVDVGDTVVLRSLTLEQFQASLDQDTTIVPAGPTVHARIAGVSRTPEDVSDAPDPFLLLSPAFYAEYHDVVGGCRCEVLVNADPAAIDQVAGELADVYPDASVEMPEDLTTRVADTVALQRRTWLLIALTAALAGAVALFQASTRVGRLLSADDLARRALGMTRGERRTGRLLVISVPIVGGSLAALPVAYALSPLAPVGLTRLAEPAPGLRWDAGILLTGALVVLVAAAVVSGIATTMHRRGHRHALLAHGGGPQVALGNRLAFGPGRGAVMGVLFAAAGLVGAMTLEHSLDHVLATPALYGADFDMSNFLDSADDKRLLGEQVAASPDVEAVGLVWSQLESTLHITGPGGEADVDANAYEDLKGSVSIRQTEGRQPARVGEIALGRAVMDQIGVGIGDRITSTSESGDVQLTIVGDNLDPGVDIAGNGASLTVEGLAALGDSSIQGTVIRFTPGASKVDLTRRYAALGFAPVTPPSEVGHVGQLGGLPGRFGQLLTLLGIVSLLNAIVLTVRSSRREVALHRTLGFTSAQVLGAHLWQSGVTALTGLVVGGGIGFVVGRAIDRQLVGNVGAIAETVLPASVWSVAIVTVVVCLAAGLTAGTVALRQRPGSVLRAE